MGVTGTGLPTNFVPFFEFVEPWILPVLPSDWVTNLQAYTTDWTVPRTVNFLKTEAEVPVRTVVEALVEGWEGFHFTSRGRRTLFSMAVGAKAEAIRSWCSRVGAVDVTTSRVRMAALMKLVLAAEGASENLMPGGRRNATNRNYLVVPVVVMVRGPGPGRAATPCYLDGVYTTTGLFEAFEAQLLALLQTNASNPGLAKRGTVTDRVRQQRFQRIVMLLGEFPQCTTLAATLLLKLKEADEITRRTDKARNRDALSMAKQSIQRIVVSFLMTT